ncbi:MAG: hypothetical protein JWM48_2114 [Mycobacterium sp.]|nr:hypothetical protein [Mycobacterium sp.]
MQPPATVATAAVRQIDAAATRGKPKYVVLVACGASPPGRASRTGRASEAQAGRDGVLTESVASRPDERRDERSRGILALTPRQRTPGAGHDRTAETAWSPASPQAKHCSDTVQ